MEICLEGAMKTAYNFALFKRVGVLSAEHFRARLVVVACCNSRCQTTAEIRRSCEITDLNRARRSVVGHPAEASKTKRLK